MQKIYRGTIALTHWTTGTPQIQSEFLNKAEYTFLSSENGTFSRTDHIMAHKSALNRYNRYKKDGITPCTFSDHEAMKCKVNSKKNLDRPKIRGDYEYPTRE